MTRCFKYKNGGKLLSALLLIFLAGCTTTTVYFVRHAEKLDESTDPPLTAAGQKRANDLAQRLSAEPITSVYSTNYERTRNTAQPTAASRSLTTRIYDNESSLVARLKREGEQKSVLVVGHSNTLSLLVNELTGREELGNIPGNNYDTLIVVKIMRQGRDTAYSVSHLRYGDISPAP